MRSIKLLKPQPSPKSSRTPLSNITNFFNSLPKGQKEQHRSPSHSPSQNSHRIQRQDKQSTKQMPLTRHALQTKQSCHSPRYIPHKDKRVRFRTQNDGSNCVHCEHCPLQTHNKGHRMLPLRNGQNGSKMMSQAKEYLTVLDQFLKTITDKMSSLYIQRSKADSKYLTTKQDIEDQRSQVIARVNQQYNRQIRQHQQTLLKSLKLIDEQEVKCKTILQEFMTSREDIRVNMKEMSGNIRMEEFRQIMDIYWKKLEEQRQVNESFCYSQEEVNRSIVHQYQNQQQCKNKSFDQQTYTQKHPKQIGKEFTFSKNMWQLDRARGTYSLEEGPICDSGESIVEQKMMIA